MVGVNVTPGVQKTSPTLTVAWQAVAGGAVNYTVKYSTQPGEVNTPPEGALAVKGIRGTSTILTALERGTTYYIWVVGVSEGGEGQHSDRKSALTYDSELDSTNCMPLLTKGHMCVGLCDNQKYIIVIFYDILCKIIPIIDNIVITGVDSKTTRNCCKLQAKLMNSYVYSKHSQLAS